jgi:uncharacterized membrane protein
MGTSKIYQTSEGKVLIAGGFMLILLICVIGFYGVVDYERARTLILVFIAHTFGGRAAGIGLCIMNELNLVWTIVYNFYLEALIVCFTYSIFVLSLNNYIKAQWVKSQTNKLMQKAEKYKDKIGKYGWVGIFLFVMIPLPVTGPVIGSSVGYLLKMGIWRNLTAVLSGTLAAIVVWTIGFDFLEQHVHVIQYILASILFVVLLSYANTIKKSIKTRFFN